MARLQQVFDVRSAARVHTALALRTLKEICKDPKCPPSARVAAATELIDRGWGRPDQHIEISAKIPDAMTDDELNAELAKIGLLIEGKALGVIEDQSNGRSVLETCRPESEVIDNKEEP